MVQTIEAVFHNGTLQPTTPLNGVSEGQRVRLTVQSDPKPTPQEGLSEEEREYLFLKKLEQQGFLDTSVWPVVEGPKDFQPIKISGPPISETIIEDRR